MSEEFTFDDETKGVLGKKTPKKKAKQIIIKDDDKKNHRVQCYLTEKEFQKLSEILDGRPASVYFRKLLLDQLDK